MKHIKPYQIFEASAPALTAEQIDWLDKCAAGRWKLNSQTGLVDVDGSIYCAYQSLQDFKGVKFGKVSGSFYCERNQLTTLVGAPQAVRGRFDCSDNELTSLVGAPQSVEGDFDCERNPVSVSTLKGIFALMKRGMAYQQALKEHWPKMEDEDRALMYKEMPNLPPEDVRKYKALSTYGNIKGYL